MKIAFVSSLDLNLYLFRLSWVKALKTAGIDVCCILPKDDESKKTENEGIRVIYYYLNRRSFNPLQGVLTVYNLYQIFRKERFCAVHTFTIKPNIYGAIAAKLAGVPVVISQVTGLGYIYTANTFKAKFLKLFSDLLYKIVFKIATKIIFQNQSDFTALARLLDINKMVLIKGSGVDTDYYSTLNINDDEANNLKKDLHVAGRTVVTLIARLYWSKGVKEFVDAAGLIHDKFKNILFLIVGWQDKGSPEVIPDKFIEKQSCEFIRFLGKREDIRELLSITDIYVLPSYREGLPHSILEAMSMSKPVVTTEVPGCMEVVENGVNGILVPPKNSSKLAQAIVKLVLDSALRNRFGDAGRDKALKFFSNKIILKEVLNLYKSLIPGIMHEDGPWIRKATLADCPLIAKMHRECLPQSFLGSLGLNFLTLLYKELLKYQNGIILVSQEDALPCGFIAGISNSKSFYNYFLKNNFIELFIILLPKLFNLNVLNKIFEDLAYNKKTWANSVPQAELLSIAVNTGSRKKGLGKNLFASLVYEFRIIGVHEFKILVGGGLGGAKDFYKELGCQKIYGFKLHNETESDIYVFRG